MRYLTAVLCCSFLAGASVSAADTVSGQAAASPRIQVLQWPAYWIACPGAPHNEYGVYLFRKNLELAAEPGHYVVHIAADARYRLWVNGHAVSFGPQRGAPASLRYDTIDLAPWLRAGTNVLAARVWSYGEMNPIALMTSRTGFLLQGDSESEDAVDTNSSWRVLHDEAYRPFRVDFNKVPGYFAVGPGDRVNAEAHPWGWEAPAYDDRAWAAARQLEHGIPWGRGPDVGEWLVPRNIPAMEETPQRFATIRRSSGAAPSADFVRGNAPFTVAPHTRATVLLDQGFETNAFIHLTVGGGKDSRVGLTYAEALVDAKGRKGNRNEIEGREIIGLGDEFRADGGDERTFSPMDFRTFRYVQMEIETSDAPLVVKDLKGTFTGYPFKERGSFSSDDPELARIWQVGWRTARLCAFETYMDCPYYEQLQYVGDTRIQCLLSLYVSGDDRLARNALDLLDRSRISDGLTQSRYPSAVPQIINTFSLFWIEMVHDYWMHRRDDVFVRERLAGLQTVLGWFEGKIDPKTGLLGPLPYWSFADWAAQWSWNGDRGLGGEPDGAREGGSAIISLQLAGTLNHAAELCRAYGRADLAEHYERCAANLRQAAVRLCWDEHRGLFADTPAKHSFSQHANTMAVLSGAISGDAARDLMQRVAHDASLTQSSTYFRFYLLRAMKQAGLGDDYLTMLGPWKTMLDTGLSTFAEQPDPTRSDCHAWSASPVYELLATVCGIEPGSPGFETVRIEPHLGALQHAEGTVPIPQGEIKVSLVREGEGLRARITLPVGMGGTLIWKGRKTALTGGEQSVKVE